MTSLVEKIMNADKAIRELYASMLEIFNQEDMDYKIEFQDKCFDFWAPLTQEEKEEMDERKEEITLALMKDAFEKLSVVVSSDPEDDDLRFTWINIANLQRSTKKSSTQSIISSEAPYIVDEGTSKELDYDSIYIQAQRKDLSDEEKWNILLSNFVDKKSLAEQSDISQ